MELGDVGQRLLDVFVGRALPLAERVERGLLGRQGTVDARDVGLCLHHVVGERLDRLFETFEDVGQVALDAVELLDQRFELSLVFVGRGLCGFGRGLSLAGQFVGLVGLGLGVGDGQLQLGIAFGEVGSRVLQSLFQAFPGVFHQGACAFERGGVAIGYEPLSFLNGGGKVFVGRLQVANFAFNRRYPAVDQRLEILLGLVQIGAQAGNVVIVVGARHERAGRCHKKGTEDQRINEFSFHN